MGVSKAVLTDSREVERVARVAVRLRTENLPDTHFMPALARGALGEVLATH